MAREILSRKEWFLIILYYKRPYISINKSFRRYVVADLQDVVNKADCLRRYHSPDDNYTWNECCRDGVLRDVFDQSPRVGLPTLNLHFLDEKMWDVENRKEAFGEIELFTSVNRIPVQYTMVRQHEDRMHIILYDKEDLLQNVVVEFILSNRLRRETPYIALWDEQEQYLRTPNAALWNENEKCLQDCDDIVPIGPDKYLRAYFKAQAERGGW